MFQRSLQWVLVVLASILGAPAVAQDGGCSPAWLPDLMPPGPNFVIKAMTNFNDGKGQKLVAAGANAVALWDGLKWTSITKGNTDGEVRALAVYDDGNGEALYAGGNFTTIDGVPATTSIARWNGKNWTAVAGPWYGGSVSALLVFTDANGPALFAGGYLYWDQGHHIARFDGQQWTSITTYIDSGVFAMAEFDDGTGPALYVGGEFDVLDGEVRNGIAKWSGGEWSSLGSGVGLNNPTDHSGIVRTMCVTTVGGAPALAVGGQFIYAGGLNVLGSLIGESPR